MSKLPEGMELAAEAADAQGWKYELSPGSGHWTWRAPGGRIVSTAKTPSRDTTVHNDLSRLRKAGLVIRSRHQKRKAQDVATEETETVRLFITGGHRCQTEGLGTFYDHTLVTSNYPVIEQLARVDEFLRQANMRLDLLAKQMPDYGFALVEERCTVRRTQLRVTP